MTSLTDELVDGIDLKIGRTVRTVPALNFKSLRRLRPQMNLLKSVDPGAGELSDEQFDAMIEIIHTALRRNYPNLSREELEEEIDLANVGPIIQAILKGSGFTPSGEAKPGRQPK